MQTPFLSYKSFLINPGTTQAAIRAEFKTHLEAAGWQVVDDATNERLLTRPPVSETIGNALGEEWVRLTFEPTRLTLGMSYRAVQASPKIILLSCATGGYNYGYRVIIGGSTVAGAASTVDATRAQNFLDALTGSTDPEVLKYTYRLFQDTDRWVVECTEKPGVTGGAIVDSSSGAFYAVPVLLRNAGNAAGAFLHTSSLRDAVAYDRAGGFVYHLGLRARSVGIAIETTSAYAGPVWGAYIPRATALANQLPGQPLVELAHVLCTSSQPSGVGSSAGSYFQTYGVFSPAGSINSATATATMGMDQGLRQTSLLTYTPLITAYVRSGESAPSYTVPNSTLDVLFREDSNAVTVNVLASPVILRGGPSGVVRSNPNQGEGRMVVQPHAMLEDVLVFHGTANNESLHLLTQTYGAATLTADLDTVNSTVNVTSTATFAPAGTAVIGTEIITYTGKTATSLTGVTRGSGSVAASAVTGTAVYPGEWYVKINRGLIPCGPVKPV
jgi:hypothetical protein